ncbi:MAG: NAD(P)/FAD-dependent oxidoreductase, partial [Gammaproteobacteria bacterium]|nr:NAD(P)/FAD-dependent oxidoreductase [Gammaproteobacteria bacterium]
MRSFSRRSLIGHAAAAAVVAGAASPMLNGTARPRVVVVGGGAGGASVAHHLARDAGNALDVVLIEPSRTYHTCFFSNLYLGGLFDRAGLIHGYDRLAALPGLQIVHDWVSSIDPDTRSVRLGSDVQLRYDRLVL